MSSTELVVITLGLLLGTNLLGLVFSVAAVRTDILAGLRTQKSRSYADGVIAQRLPLTLLNLSTLMLLTAVMLYIGHGIFSFASVAVSTVAVQLLVVFVCDDAFFYAWHRFLHENKTAYRKIHKYHHRAHKPFAMDYLHVHPLEWSVGALGPVIGFAAVYMLYGSVHAYTLWATQLIRNLHELAIHSGFESAIGRHIPFYGDNWHHDEHHARPHKGNYSSTFTWWDWIFCTGIPRPGSRRHREHH